MKIQMKTIYSCLTLALATTLLSSPAQGQGGGSTGVGGGMLTISSAYALRLSFLEAMIGNTVLEYKKNAGRSDLTNPTLTNDFSAYTWQQGLQTSFGSLQSWITVYENRKEADTVNILVSFDGKFFTTKVTPKKFKASDKIKLLQLY